MKIALQGVCMFSLLVLLGFSDCVGMNVSFTTGIGLLDGQTHRDISGIYVNTDGTQGDQVLSHEVRFPTGFNAASVRAETEIGRVNVTLDATKNINKGSGKIKEGTWETLS